MNMQGKLDHKARMTYGYQGVDTLSSQSRPLKTEKQKKFSPLERRTSFKGGLTHMPLVQKEKNSFFIS